VFSASPDASVNLKITDFGTSRESQQSIRATEPSYMAYNPEKNHEEQKNFTRGVGTLIFQVLCFLIFIYFIRPPKCSTEVPSMPSTKPTYFHLEFFYGRLCTRKNLILIHLTINGLVLVHFSDFSLNFPELCEYIKSGKRLPIDQDVNPHIKSIIEKCWHRDPTQRPSFDKLVLELDMVYESVPNSEVQVPQVLYSVIFSHKNREDLRLKLHLSSGR
jgi:hypothetical protein